MKAIITCELNGTRFYLTEEHYASDCPDRAKWFRDLTDAALTACREVKDYAWRGEFAWTPAYRLADGTICQP